ncbi:Cmx/CmrA family chloramphenicol efflux MFS transporter [Rhizobium lusitanum]|uniref:DHA1 family inner membrane transport protein n=1 Tax=Rhizobium lusitanum TaxID=293958 RepID=A0A7X0IUQ9_9HYPH|nr:Cmx/CmrA family chloramphenicol efflux MFS transporter [Rhizobium lusitanum]MBB6487093.1 DHA1 family inner membrane transport protein [Rhizobium lusitanum]
MPIAIYVLGLSIFCLGTTEFMISGLLPELAHDFHVSIPTAAWLISGFALAVAIGGPPLTLLSLRIRQKTALIFLLVLFNIGQILGAVAPSYNVLMVARVITALSVGAFFGIGAVVAVNLAGEGRHARAIAIMFGGLTVANIVGVPLGAFIGQHWGWRASFWIVAGLACISLVAVIALVPTSRQPPSINVRAELRPLKRLALWPALLTTALSQAALFAVFSYISPILTELAGFSSAAVPPLLVLFGAGTFVGSYIGGRFADRHLSLNLYVGLLALALVVGLFPIAVALKSTTVAIVLMFGVAAFAINPALQTQVMRVAADAPTVSSTINISAFNIGNTLGPWLGGIAISAGYGYAAPEILATGLVLASLVAAAVTAKLVRASISNIPDRPVLADIGA